MSNVVDLVKNGNAVDARVAMVEEAVRRVPELAFFDAAAVKGQQFQSLSRTSLPTTGWRAVNHGIACSQSGYALRTFNLAVLDGIVRLDKAAADADFRGREVALAQESIGVTASAFRTIADAIWYGKLAEVGFSGAAELVADDLVVMAGGVGDETYSVYAVGNGFADGCAVTFNESRGILGEGDIEYKQQLVTDADGKPYMAYVGDLTSWAGFSCTNAHKIARLMGVDKAGVAGGKTLTDDMLSDIVNAYAEANDGLMPDALFMPFACRVQLQKSRGVPVVVSGGGATGTIAAGIPADYNGIPIIATSALKLETQGSSGSTDSGSGPTL